MYFLYKLGFFLANTLSIKANYCLAKIVSYFFFVFAKSNKENLKENLKVVFKEKTDKEIKRYVFCVFQNFGRYIVDFFKFSKESKEDIFKKVNIIGEEHLKNSLLKNKGVILLSLHLGNWELGAAVLGHLGYKINAIVLEHENKAVNNLFFQQRNNNKIKSIPLGFQIKESFKALKRNEILAIVGDRNYTDNGVYISFFGKKALMPKGAAALSVKTKAPIVFSVFIRNENNGFDLCFEPPIECVEMEEKDLAIKHVMEKYISFFEKYITKVPDQWYVFNRIWN